MPFKNNLSKAELSDCGRCDTDQLMFQENLKVNPEKSDAHLPGWSRHFTPCSAFRFNVLLQQSDTEEDSEEQSDTSG
jgi:hypothetical protein